MTGRATQPASEAAASPDAAEATGVTGGLTAENTQALDTQLDALLADMQSQRQATVARDQRHKGTGEVEAATPAAAAGAAGISAEAAAEEAVKSIEKQVESLVEQFVDSSPPAETAPEAAGAGATEVAKAEAAAVKEPGAAATKVSGATGGVAPAGAAAPASAPAMPKPTSSASKAVATVLSAVPANINALDDQLSHLTEKLLDKAPELPPPPKPAEPAAPVAEPAATKPGAPAQAAPVAAAPKASAPAAPAVPAGPSPWSRLIEALAAPLRGKPQLVRDTVGWVGLNTVFLTSVVWMYRLWFQRPEVIEAQHAPASLVTGENGGASDAEKHAGEKAGGEKAAGEKTGAETAGGKDEPLTGAEPVQRKRATYAISDVMAEKFAGAKPKGEGGEKDGGHGGAKKATKKHGEE